MSARLISMPVCSRSSVRRLSTLAAATVACLSFPALAAGPTTLGAGVTLEKVTPIADLIERPDTLEGQTVRVEGVVTAVCTHMGCWMALAPESSASAGSGGASAEAGASASAKPAAAETPGAKPAAIKTVRLKVDDGVIVFPVSAKGHRAIAQGIVERIQTRDAEGNEAAAEHAKQEGRAQAKAAAAAPYHIKATGAIIE